jgi:hypothetical protein
MCGEWYPIITALNRKKGWNRCMPATAGHTPVPFGYILNSKIILCKFSASPDNMSLEAAVIFTLIFFRKENFDRKEIFIRSPPKSIF